MLPQPGRTLSPSHGPSGTAPGHTCHSPPGRSHGDRFGSHLPFAPWPQPWGPLRVRLTKADG
jgi:hypothetical protein